MSWEDHVSRQLRATLEWHGRSGSLSHNHQLLTSANNLNELGRWLTLYVPALAIKSAISLKSPDSLKLRTVFTTQDLAAEYALCCWVCQMQTGPGNALWLSYRSKSGSLWGMGLLMSSRSVLPTLVTARLQVHSCWSFWAVNLPGYCAVEEGKMRLRQVTAPRPFSRIPLFVLNKFSLNCYKPLICRILKKIDFGCFCQCSHAFSGVLHFQRSLVCHFRSGNYDFFKYSLTFLSIV